MHNDVIIVPGSGLALLPVTSVGFTKQFAENAFAPDGRTLYEDNVLHDCYKLNDRGQESASGLHISVSSPDSTSAVAHIYGNATNPLEPPSVTPSIDWDVSVKVSAADPNNPQYTMVGTHDCFPAFEAYIGFKQIYGYTPASATPDYIGYCLAGFNPVDVGTLTGAAK